MRIRLVILPIRSSFAIIALSACITGVRAQPNLITVHDAGPAIPVSRYMTGACLEDVNHEIYGGIYSQMIFGESFQEPAAAQLQDFIEYGGNWSVINGELSVTGSNGPKMVLNGYVCGNCEAGVDVKIGSNAGPSGLILKVMQPGIGPDRFHGYEISLGPNLVRIGKHENNYTLLRDVSFSLPIGQWVALKVKMTGATISVFINGDSATSYTDAAPLPAGSIGLRAWLDGTTGYRNMWVNTGGTVKAVAFTQVSGGISGMWSAVQKGSATGGFGMEKVAPFKGAQSQTLTFTGGIGEMGIENQGLNRQGMAFAANQPYEGYVWVRARQPVALSVALESPDGSAVYDEATLPGSLQASNGDWTRLEFTLIPKTTVFPGRFAIKLKQAGTVTVGHAFLQPGAWGRFQGLPVRKDVAEGLIAQKLTVLRYGGTMINDDGYRWKNMIGPRDRRPMTSGHWYPYSSNGWGIFDFLDFCEKAGVLGIPALNSYETAQDMADFMEYLNGSATTAWGAKRAADGHPAPYGVKYVEIGNEEVVDAGYFNRFQSIAGAVWAKDSGIIPIVGDFGYDNVITNPYAFTGSWSGITTLAPHKQILELAKAVNREVWFDIHINTNAPPDPTNIPAIVSFSEQLGAISPGAKYKLVNFELNTFSSHSLSRALANANAISRLERIGDRLTMVCSANCLQVDGQNDNGWDQGLLFMNPEKVWAQPPYYVTQMAAEHYLSTSISASVSGNPGTLFNVAATQSPDGSQIAIKVVNGASQVAAYRFAFDKFLPTGRPVSIMTLSGAPDAANTASNPSAIMPTRSTVTGTIDQLFSFPANSFTVIHYSPVTTAAKAGRELGSRLRIRSTVEGIAFTWNEPVAGYAVISILDMHGDGAARLRVSPRNSGGRVSIAWNTIVGKGAGVSKGTYFVSVSEENGGNAFFKVSR